MSDCQICGHDIDNHGRSGCCAHGCSCLRTYARTDHPNYAEQDARIAALTEQVSQADRANGELLRRLQAAEDETHLFATELADKKCLGLETIQRLEDKIIALTERTERAEKANALLRAECEAFREFEDFILDEEPAKSLSEAEEWVKKHNLAHAKKVAARAATDAAGALKGVEG